MRIYEGFCKKCGKWGGVNCADTCQGCIKVERERNEPVWAESAEPDPDARRKRDLVDYGCTGGVAQLMKWDEEKDARRR